MNIYAWDEHLSLIACTCCCVWAWGVTAEIYLSGFFQTSLFLSHFFLIFILFYFIYLFIIIFFIHSNSCFFFSFTLYSSFLYLSLQGEVNSCRNFSVSLTLLCLDGFEGCWSNSWNPNPIQVPPDDSIFALYLFGLLLGFPFLYNRKISECFLSTGIAKRTPAGIWFHLRNNLTCAAEVEKSKFIQWRPNIMFLLLTRTIKMK